ncbi:hypothetical protein IE81DRAFT_258126 [Ceraceosorus guamensis]|uniref:Uncharacterized protein n=1 Tax=Ceraceosorus guamensis TaxID=1522189 RepID=A0A316VRD9_9BASI|nr:hypothetical protein IE81DRAFT_258126 [Ceraceosorus guamensis]PWN39784.1 hypothetical protein IE81DRAFT_258126 [Ceraceosorus guamensis]
MGSVIAIRPRASALLCALSAMSHSFFSHFTSHESMEVAIRHPPTALYIVVPNKATGARAQNPNRIDGHNSLLPFSPSPFSPPRELQLGVSFNKQLLLLFYLHRSAIPKLALGWLFQASSSCSRRSSRTQYNSRAYKLVLCFFDSSASSLLRHAILKHLDTLHGSRRRFHFCSSYPNAGRA